MAKGFEGNGKKRPCPAYPVNINVHGPEHATHVCCPPLMAWSAAYTAAEMVSRVFPCRKPGKYTHQSTKQYTNATRL